MKAMVEQKSTAKGADHEVWISGSVTALDLRYTASGVAILQVTLAGEVDREGRPRPYYLQVRALKGRAEYWADRLQPGTVVLARGELSQSSWEGRTYTSILARELRVVDPGHVALSEPDARGQRREARGLNRFLGTGLLVREPELRYTADGRAVAHARVLFQSGGREPKPAFVGLEAWGEAAEELARLPKGTPVFAEGSLRVDSWTDREGQKRYDLRVVASWVKPLLKLAKVEEEEEDPLKDFPPEDDLPF